MVNIYLITNLINGMQYVGQTSRKLSERFYQHCYPQDESRACPYLYAAIRKYGKDNFKIELITIVENDRANEVETEYISKYNTVRPKGYNLCPTGFGTRGYTFKMNLTETEKAIRRLNASINGSVTTEAKLKSCTANLKMTIAATIERNKDPKFIRENADRRIFRVFIVRFPTGEIQGVRNITAFFKFYNLGDTSIAYAIALKRPVQRGKNKKKTIKTHHKGYEFIFASDVDDSGFIPVVDYGEVILRSSNHPLKENRSFQDLSLQ